MFQKFNNQQGKSKRNYLFVLLIPLFVFAAAGLVQWLWNAILPEVAHAGHISYWQSLGLLVLCRILFGGFGSHRPDKHFAHHKDAREKWMNMSEEEKQKFKSELKSRCRTTDQE